MWIKMDLKFGNFNWIKIDSKDQNLNLTRTKRIHFCPFHFRSIHLLGELQIFNVNLVMNFRTQPKVPALLCYCIYLIIIILYYYISINSHFT